MRLHQDLCRFACKYANCKRRFTNQFALEAHIRLHTGENQVWYTIVSHVKENKITTQKMFHNYETETFYGMQLFNLRNATS